MVAVANGAYVDLHPARLVAIPLERSEEFDVLDGRDLPARREQVGGLGKGLDPHHTGQDRSAVDAMVVQERLRRRVEIGEDDGVTVARHHDVPDQRSGTGNGHSRRR